MNQPEAKLIEHFADLPPRISQPPAGLEYSHFINGDGASIRTASVAPTDPHDVRAVVINVGGFGESIERYHEVMADQLDRGMAVHMMDWRGQGGSQRYYPDLPQRPGAQGYKHDIADLHQFITEQVRPQERWPGRPVILMAHSMGGNIAMRYLHDHPGTVDASVQLSPMLGVNTKPLPRPLARLISRTMTALGQGHRYARPDMRDWRDETDVKITEKSMRRQSLNLLYRDLPGLRVGHATFGWLNAALKSIQILSKPSYLAEIRTPLLLTSARRDTMVDPAAHEHAAQHLPDVTMARFRDGNHHPLMTPDDQRAQVWEQIDRFLARKLPGVDLSPRPRERHAGTMPYQPSDTPKTVKVP